MSFFEELRRRNVFRVGAAYAVVAWLLIQVADVLMPRLGAPEWFVNAFIFVLILGFPVALVISWIFEVTPEGITTQQAVDAGANTTSGKKLNTVIIGGMALAIVFLVVDNYVLDPPEPYAGSQAELVQSPDDEITATTGLARSIAVLPFANLSSDPEQEYFSDGLAEEILNKLAQVPDLQVAARTSAFSFKNRNEDMRVIADTLGVNYLLEGSVRNSGDQMRITAQLIQADNGFHLWSKTYDQQIADIFAVQDEIALAVSTALQVTLGTGTFALPGNTRNVEAYQHFLKGLAFINGGGNRQDLLFMQSGVDELVEAVTLAPDFARAWLLLWLAYDLQIGNATQDRVPELQAKRQEAFNRANTLAPDMPELQLVSVAQLNNRVEQEQALLEILDNRGSIEATATTRYANFLANTGRSRDALRHAERAIRLNPSFAMGYYLYGTLLLQQGRLTEAREVLEEGNAILDGGAGGFLPVLGWKIAYAENGRQGWGEQVLAQTNPDSTNVTDLWNIRYARWLVAEDAQAALDEVRAYAMDPSIPLINQAALVSIASLLGDLDLAEEYLNRFGILDPWDIHFSELRKREGFKTWVRDNGLLDYWRATGNWSDYCRPLEGSDDFECF